MNNSLLRTYLSACLTTLVSSKDIMVSRSKTKLKKKKKEKKEKKIDIGNQLKLNSCCKESSPCYLISWTQNSNCVLTLHFQRNEKDFFFFLNGKKIRTFTMQDFSAGSLFQLSDSLPCNSE